jgi:hypothetical protein
MTDKSDESHDPTDMSHPHYDSAKDPSSPFYVGNKSDAEQKPDEDSYKVGPGFPPKQYKWKKGCPSPYPKGRPKKVPSMKPDVKKAFEDAIFEKIEVKKGDKKVWMTKINLGLRQLATLFAKGDHHAGRDLFHYAALLGVDLQAKDVVADALEVSQQAIVAALLQRHQRSDERAPDDHVKAPPDLLDDDATKSEPSETSPISPQPETSAKKQAEPVLDEHGRPLPVSDIRYIREMSRRNLAQEKKNQGGS